MIVKCPCGKSLKVRPEQKGKKGRCPKCKRILLIPMPQSVRNELTDKIPELDKMRLSSKATTAPAKHHSKTGGQIIQGCKIEERDGDILIQPSAPRSCALQSAEPHHCEQSDDKSLRSVCSTEQEAEASSQDAELADAPARPTPEAADEQNPEDKMPQVGDLWSRSMIEIGNRLCLKCNKRVPNDFKKCTHCGEYFDGVPQQNHCPNCGHDVPFLRFPRSAAELSRLLLKGVTCQVCGYNFERKTKFVRWFSLSCVVFTILWAAWFSMKSYGMLESVF